MHCRIRSPERTLYEGDATMVVARSAQGEFAVLEGHAPLLAQLREGPVRIKTASGERTFVCFGGTLDVQAGVVTILTPEALPREEIDIEALQRRASDETLDDEERGAASRRLQAVGWLEGQNA